MSAHTGSHHGTQATRRSPFADAWATVQPQCTTLAGMSVPETFAAAYEMPVMLADMSFLPRIGCKGPGAAEWLATQQLRLPGKHNRWLAHRGGVIARLGMTEYFLESSAVDTWTEQFPQPQHPQVAPVLRQDASLLLCGERVHELLLQVCSYDCAALNPDDHEAVMTQMIGVSVLMIAVAHEPYPRYRLWCDPSFATYLWHHLSEIAAELGGGPVGWRQLREFGLCFSNDGVNP